MTSARKSRGAITLPGPRLDQGPAEPGSAPGTSSPRGSELTERPVSRLRKVCGGLPRGASSSGNLTSSAWFSAFGQRSQAGTRRRAAARDKLLEVRAGQEALVCKGRFGGRQAGSFQPQDRRPAPTPTVGKARRGPGKSAGGTLSMEAVTRPLSRLWAAPSAPRAARSTCWPDTAPRTEEWTFKQS